jgi:hypothetical protein
MSIHFENAVTCFDLFPSTETNIQNNRISSIGISPSEGEIIWNGDVLSAGEHPRAPRHAKQPFTPCRCNLPRP